MPGIESRHSDHNPESHRYQPDEIQTGHHAICFHLIPELYVSKFGKINWYEVRQLRQELPFNSDLTETGGCCQGVVTISLQGTINRYCLVTTSCC